MSIRLMTEDIKIYKKPSSVIVQTSIWHRDAGNNWPMFRPYFNTFNVLGFICMEAGIPVNDIKYINSLSELREFKAIDINGLDDRWVEDLLYTEEARGLSEKQRRERIQYLGRKVGIEIKFKD